MIVCVSTYRRELSQDDDTLLAEHFAFMDTQYEGGRLIASGPRIPRTGGVIIVRGDDLASARLLLAHEPLAREGIATYLLFPFRATRASGPDLLDADTQPQRPTEVDRCVS